MSDPSLVQISFKIKPEMPYDMKKFILSAFTDYYEKYYPEKILDVEECLRLRELYPVIGDLARNDAYHNIDMQICQLDSWDVYDIDNNEISHDDGHWLDEDGNEISSDDSGTYNEYITHFYIRTPERIMIEFYAESNDPLYISQELNTLIRKKSYAADGMVNIPLNVLQDNILFYIKINNNEISKTMNDIINIINKSSVTEEMTKDEALQTLVDLIIDGNLSVD